MINWEKVRGILYLALLGMALAAVYGMSLLGWATYDISTGMVTIQPFHLTTVVTYITTWIIAGATAFVALVKGWGARKNV